MNSAIVFLIFLKLLFLIGMPEMYNSKSTRFPCEFFYSIDEFQMPIIGGFLFHNIQSINDLIVRYYNLYFRGAFSLY